MILAALETLVQGKAVRPSPGDQFLTTFLVLEVHGVGRARLARLSCRNGLA
jgi:hypothetical protein